MDDYQTEYQRYQKSLLDNSRFIDSFNDKYYEVRQFYSDQKNSHSYHFLSMTLLILGSVLSGVFFFFPTDWIGNIIIRIVLFLLANTAFLFSYLLSTQHDKMMTHTFFDRYIKPQLLQERVNYDIKNFVSRDQERLTELLHTAKDDALFLLDPEQKKMQQECEEHLKALSLTTLKLISENYSNQQKQLHYTSLSKDILTDYTLHIEINKHLGI